MDVTLPHLSPNPNSTFDYDFLRNSTPSSIDPGVPVVQRQHSARFPHKKYHDPRQFVGYCFHVLYGMCQLNKTTLFGQARHEFKEMISSNIIDALHQDPSLAGAVFETQQMVSKSILHWACHFGLSLELIQYICTLCPSAVYARAACGSQRTEGIFPIDEALDNQDTSIDTIQFLLENPSHYPKAVLLYVLKKALTKFRLSDALPLLERFLPEQTDQRELTRSIQFEYGYNDDIAADLLSFLAKLHQVTQFTWNTCSNYLSFTVESRGNIVVKVGSEFEVPRVLLRLLQIPNILLTSIDCSQISHFCWFNDFIAILSGTNLRFQSLIQRQSTPSNDDKQVCRPSLDTLFYSVERLSIRYQTAETDMMNRLFSAVYQAMPRLRCLSLRNCWQGHLTHCLAFDTLPLLADRLEEIEVGGDPHSIFAILRLLKCSQTLKKITFLQISPADTFTLDDNYSSAIAALIQVSAYDVIEKSENVNKKRKGHCSGLQELTVDYPFKDIKSFEIKLVMALEYNQALKMLVLPQMTSFVENGLMDLVRLQKNSTLQTIVLQDDQQSSELEYWCRRNQLLRALEQDMLSIQQALCAAMPYLKQSHQSPDIPMGSKGLEERFRLSLIYEVIRYQPDLWKPKIS